jgi:hypothetical protein
MQAGCQVVFTDVLVVGRLDVDGQNFAPIGLHKKDAASDWLLIKRHCSGMKGLPGVQLQNYSENSSYRRDFSIYRKEDVVFQPKIRGASEKLRNQPRHLLRPTSVNFRQYCRNLCHETVPLSIIPLAPLSTGSPTTQFKETARCVTRLFRSGL